MKTTLVSVISLLVIGSVFAASSADSENLSVYDESWGIWGGKENSDVDPFAPYVPIQCDLYINYLIKEGP